MAEQVNVNNFELINIGEIEFESQNFHNKTEIYPMGYCIQVLNYYHYIYCIVYINNANNCVSYF